MRSALLLATLANVLCAGCLRAESRPIRGPDGTENWYAVTCRKSQMNCYEEAGRICPGGYDMADSSGGTSGIYVSHTAYASYAVPLYHGELLIKCHGRPAVTAETTAE